MAVAEALHLELQDWIEGDRARLAIVINQVDLGGPRQPRAGNVVHPMARGRHALVLSVLNAGHGGFRRIERRDDAFPDQGLAAWTVEEDGVGNVVAPHQRRPEEEHARWSCWRAADLALTDSAHTPGAVPRLAKWKLYLCVVFISSAMAFPIAAYPARLGCSLSPGPPVDELGCIAGLISPVAASNVTASKSMTPSKILLVRRNSLSALRLASTSSRPCVMMMLCSADVSVAATIVTPGMRSRSRATPLA